MQNPPDEFRRVLHEHRSELNAQNTSAGSDELLFIQWTKSQPTVASGNTVPRIKQMTFDVI
jgi:hypothetical protein